MSHVVPSNITVLQSGGNALFTQLCSVQEFAPAWIWIHAPLSIAAFIGGIIGVIFGGQVQTDGLSDSVYSVHKVGVAHSTFRMGVAYSTFCSLAIAHACCALAFLQKNIVRGLDKAASVLFVRLLVRSLNNLTAGADANNQLTTQYLNARRLAVLLWRSLESTLSWGWSDPSRYACKILLPKYCRCMTPGAGS